MAIASENLTKNQKTVLDILENASEPLKAYTILFDIQKKGIKSPLQVYRACLLYTSPSPRDATLSRMPSSA